MEEEKAEGAGAPRRRPIPCGCGHIPRGRVQGRLGAEPKPQRARLERWLLVPYMTPAVLDGLRGETGRMEGAGRAPGRCRGAGGVRWVAGGTVTPLTSHSMAVAMLAHQYPGPQAQGSEPRGESQALIFCMEKGEKG